MDFVAQSAYYHAKAGCYLCGRTDSLVDTSVQIEGEGVLALCIGCIKGDLCMTAGIDVDALEATAEAIVALQDELAQAKDATKVLRTKLRAQKRPAPAEPALV